MSRIRRALDRVLDVVVTVLATLGLVDPYQPPRPRNNSAHRPGDMMTARPDRTYRDIPIPDHIWTAWDNPAGGAWRVGIDAALHHDTRTSRRINRANHIAAGIAAAAYFVGSIVNPRPIEIWRNCRAKKAAAKASVEEQRRREHRGRGER